MKKVMVGGTFTILHEGHLYLLEKAKSFGDYLIVVIASDKTVIRTKGMLIFNAKERQRIVGSLKCVNKAIIGNEDDFFKVVEQEKPDIIVLGYDQKMDENWIRERADKIGMKIKIIRVKEEIKGYKTSEIINKIAKLIEKRGRKPPQ